MNLQSVKCQLRIYVTLIFSLLVMISCQRASESTIIPSTTVSLDLVEESVPFSTMSPEKTEIDLALGISCQPPCWLDIRPGITTIQDARFGLEKYFQKGIVVEWEESNWGDCPEIPLLMVSTQPSFTDATIVFKAGKAYGIELSQEPRYTLGEMVENYGPPEFVSISSSSLCSECPESLNWDLVSETTISSRVYYPTKGIKFDVLASQVMGGCICPNMIVGHISYFVPISLNEGQVIETNPNQDTCELQIRIDEPVVEWLGFGSGYGISDGE